MSMPSASDIIELVTTLAPGLVILGIRQWFVAAPPPKLEERAFAYASVSIVYYAIANPLIALCKPWAKADPWQLNALEYFIVPTIIGIIFGIATLKDTSDRFWRLFGVSPFHHAQTAWDYVFSRLKKAPFVLVTLSDGSKVGGFYGEGSFAASSSTERDLLIIEIWTISEDKPWTRQIPVRSILLCGRDIRSVEFFKEPDDD